MKIKFFLYIAQWLCRHHKSGRKSRGRTRCLTWIILGLSFSHSISAVPKFLLNSDQWTEQSQIFLANCPEGCLKENIQGFKPKTHWTPDSQLLDLVLVGPSRKHCAKTDGACLKFKDKAKTRASVIYALAVTPDHPSVIYQFDNTSGKELGSYSLSLAGSEGFLLIEDIYFENAWHTFLICAINSIELAAQIFIWDITDPSAQFNKPLCLDRLIALNESHFNLSARPCVLRYPGGEYGLSIPGRNRESMGLLMIPLEHLQQTHFVKTGSAPLTSVQAIDNGQGRVNTLYALDAQGVLWSIGLTDSKAPVAVKILEGVDPKSAIKVVQSIQRPGTTLYYFQHPDKGAGLFKLSIDQTGKELKKDQIALGCFRDLWIRWGYLILAVESSLKPPLVFSLCSQGEQLRNVVWKTVSSAADNSRPLQAKLFWDPDQRLETLIILNDKCQITMLQAAITRDQYGRVAWRRAN